MANLNRCQLFIPHIYYLKELRLDDEGRITQESIDRVTELAADNYRSIERWANLIGPMICNCDCGNEAE